MDADMNDTLINSASATRHSIAPPKLRVPTSARLSRTSESAWARCSRRRPCPSCSAQEHPSEPPRVSRRLGYVSTASAAEAVWR
jgi:hypothetical protein